MTNRRDFMRLAAGGAVVGAVGVGASQGAQAAVPDYAIPSTGIPTLPIVGTGERFPVRRIYCMGMNYALHIAEGGMDPGAPPPPFYFMKANDQIVENGSTVSYPLLTKNYHHEIELVVAIGKGGVNIPVEQAWDHIFGYAVGLDMTRRDLQTEKRELKQPWELGKSFDQSAPCAPIHPVSLVGHFTEGRIHLSVNGKTRQDSNISELITDVPGCVSFISTTCELKPGDLIYTGTPDGVGPVVSGDVMIGEIDRLGTLTIKVA